MEMPRPSSDVLNRKARIVERLAAALSPDTVISDTAETRAYECDGLTAYTCPPLCVVLPEKTEQVSEVLRICHAEGDRLREVAVNCINRFEHGSIPGFRAAVGRDQKADGFAVSLATYRNYSEQSDGCNDGK